VRSNELLKSVIANKVKQSRFYAFFKTKDCFVAPFLAMTIFSVFYEIVRIEKAKTGRSVFLLQVIFTDE